MQFDRYLRSFLLAFGLLIGSVSPAWSQTQFFGFQFDNQITLQEQPLQLNGVGGRGLAFLKVYATALYLPQKSGKAEEIIRMPGAKRLQIRMAYGVEAKEFKKALIRGIEKNYTPNERALLQERTNSFAAIIDSFGRVRKGDTINMDFIPQTGLVVTVNGQTKGQPIAGSDFYAAVLNIFIGKTPTDDAQKARLLGRAV